MRVPISAIMMAATHILKASEPVGRNEDGLPDEIMSRGTYRKERLREVAELAFDLAGAVEAEAANRIPVDIGAAGSA